MRILTALAIGILGCGRPATATRPAAISATPIVPAAPAEVVAEVLSPIPAPSFGRLATIFHTRTGAIAVSLDDAGVARHTGNPVFTGQTDRILPFSEPVEDVEFIKTFTRPHNAPNPQYGRLFCARTRSAALECLLDFDATATAARHVMRFRFPIAGVNHIGTTRPFTQTHGFEGVVCAATGTAPASCWTFDYEGARAVAYTLDPRSAELAALGMLPHIAQAWRPTAANVRELVSSDPIDGARIIGRDTNIAVQCARLDSGELACFGPGVYGELGDGTLATTVRASRPLGAAKVVDVAMRRHHACAVVEDGRVACWGELPESLPLPRGHQTKPLPMCALDRAASAAQFATTRTQHHAEVEACRKSCEGAPGLDRCLGCVEKCTPIPYVFRHATPCQEPLGLEQTLTQQGMHCIPPSQQPQWLADRELRNDTPDVDLTLAPVFLRGIDDAISIALPGRPSLCVVRRGGALTCLD